MILRFAEALPGDLYQLTIVGSGTQPLMNLLGKPFHDGQDFTTGFELDLPPQVVAVVPQPVTRNGGGQLQQSRNTIEVYFNDDPLSTSGNTSVTNKLLYTLIAANNPGDPLDDVAINPTQVVYDQQNNKAVLTFSDDLNNLGHFTPGDTSYLGQRSFRLRIGNQYQPVDTWTIAPVGDPGTSPLTMINSSRFGAVAGLLIPEYSVFRVSHRAPLDATSPATITFQFVKTGHSVTDSSYVPVVYTGGESAAQIATLVTAAINQANRDRGLYVVATANTSATPPTVTLALPTEEGSSFAAAQGIAGFGAETGPHALELAGSIATTDFNTIEYPGSIDEPGARNMPDGINGMMEWQNHYVPTFAADSVPGPSTYYYNFKYIYSGSGPTAMYNQIRNSQDEMDRVREIFELYSHYLGVQFTEVPDTFQPGFTDTLFVIVKGDMRVIGGGATGPNGDDGTCLVPTPGAGLTGMLIMNNDKDWGNNEFGGHFFTATMREIGYLLGLGDAYDMPAGSITGNYAAAYTAGADLGFPGNQDIVSGQYLFRPDSNDIDLYKFTVTQSGDLSAETIAERLQSASSLNTLLTLYDGSHNVIARNDDYFGKDSYIKLHLTPGNYYVVVTASGELRLQPGGREQRDRRNDLGARTTCG